MNLINLREAVERIGGNGEYVPYLPYIDSGWSDFLKPMVSGDLLLRAAIAEASQLVVDRPFTSGSILSHAHNPEARVGRKSELLAKMQEVLTTKIDPMDALIDESKLFRGVELTFKTAMAMGAYLLKNFEPMTYFTKSLVAGMLGPNIDFQATDGLDDVIKSNEKLIRLLHLSTQEFGNGVKRRPAIFSTMSYFGRFSTHKFTVVGDSLTGDMNFMLMSREHKERYIKMLNYRQDFQTGRLKVTKDGEVYVEVPDEKLVSMEMVGESENIGEWLMHTARAVRMMAVDGRLDDSNIIIESFTSKIPKNKKINYEAVVGFIQNLIVAEEHNPELTRTLITKLGLEQYFIYGEAKKESKLRRWFGKNRNDVSNDVRRGMEEAERQMIDATRYGGEGSEMRLAVFAPQVVKYLPVSLDKLYRLIPKPEDRERIVARYVGEDIDTYLVDDEPWIDRRVGSRVVEVNRRYYEDYLMFEDIITEAKSKGWSAEKIAILERGREELLWRAYGQENKVKRKIERMIHSMTVSEWEARNGMTWSSDSVN